MHKYITLKAIEQEIGKVDMVAVSGRQLWLMVLGAEVLLRDKAWRDKRVDEVSSPSDVQLKKLAKKIIAR